MLLEDVQDPVVYQNIIALLGAIKGLQLTDEHQLSLDFFCDPETGELFYSSSPPSGGLQFLILSLDMDHKEISWKSKGLSSRAQTHLKEMGEVLKKAFTKIERLAQLLHLEWHTPVEKDDISDIIKRTYLKVSREEAEKALLNQPAGTLLFRRDPYALTLQEILRRGLKKSVQCYTLTYLDQEGIVRDRTILFANRTWMFYDDDPTLSGPSWSTISDLLQSLGLSLKQKLQSQKIA